MLLPKRMNNTAYNGTQQSNPIMVLLQITTKLREGIGCVNDTTLSRRTKEDQNSYENDSVLLHHQIRRSPTCCLITKQMSEQAENRYQKDMQQNPVQLVVFNHLDKSIRGKQKPTANDGNELQSKKKLVRFQDISIKFYAVTVGCRNLCYPANGDNLLHISNIENYRCRKTRYINSSCSRRRRNKNPDNDILCPITLDWKHAPEVIISVDNFEKQKEFMKVTKKTALKTTQSKKKCRKLCLMERRQRIADVNNIQVKDVYKLEHENQVFFECQNRNHAKNKLKISTSFNTNSPPPMLPSCESPTAARHSHSNFE